MDFIEFDENSGVAFGEKQIVLILGKSYIWAAISVIAIAIGFITLMVQITEFRPIILLFGVATIIAGICGMMIRKQVEFDGHTKTIRSFLLLGEKTIWKLGEEPLPGHRILFIQEEDSESITEHLYIKNEEEKAYHILELNCTTTAINLHDLINQYSTHFIASYPLPRDTYFN
jgi:hypothetical protein